MSNVLTFKGVLDMIKIKRIFALGLAFSMLYGTVGCKNKNKSESSSISELISEADTEDVRNTKGQTIYWLSDYDINPEENQERSTALALFEDVYGAKIEYLPAKSSELMSTLNALLQAGETVDMFPYYNEYALSGIIDDKFQPLDEYYDVLDMENSMWDDMRDDIELLEYNENHYVIPYSRSNPQFLVYKRNFINEFNLEDPYELYKNGQWTWDKFMEIMKAYAEAKPDAKLYGIGGDIGQGFVYSTGDTFVTKESGKFKNNLSSPEIEKAENLLTELKNSGLYDAGADESDFLSQITPLFYGCSDWLLADMNINHEGLDLMAVPYPKSPDTDKYCVSADLNGKMLVKGSDKGTAVAAYIRCERLVQTNEKFLNEKKAQTTEMKKTISGGSVPFITAEQYDAVQGFCSADNTAHIFDPAYYLGLGIFNNRVYNFEVRDTISNLSDAVLKYPENAESWSALKDSLNSRVDSAVALYNK